MILVFIIIINQWAWYHGSTMEVVGRAPTEPHTNKFHTCTIHSSGQLNQSAPSAVG